MKRFENNPNPFHSLTPIFQLLSPVEQLSSAISTSTPLFSTFCPFQIYQGITVILGLNPHFVTLCEKNEVNECSEKKYKQIGVCLLNSSVKMQFVEVEDVKNGSHVTGFKFILGEKSCSFDLFPSNRQYSLKWLEDLSEKVNIVGFDPNYKRKRVLHRTQNFSLIRCVNKKFQNDFAIKGYSKRQISENLMLAQQVKKQIEILRAINHPGILKMKAVHESFDSIYLVNEHLDGATLSDRMFDNKGVFQELQYQEIKSLIFLLLETLEYLTQNKIYHGDLNPRNIMFRSPRDIRPVLIDFKHADYHKSEFLQKISEGTPGYIAPELFMRGKNYKIDMEGKADIFSLGIIWYILLSNQLPFIGGSLEEVRERNKECRIPYPQIEYLQVEYEERSEAMDLLKRMLDVDPKSRVSASQALEHEYFRRVREERVNQTIKNVKFDKI